MASLIAWVCLRFIAFFHSNLNNVCINSKISNFAEKTELTIEDKYKKTMQEIGVLKDELGNDVLFLSQVNQCHSIYPCHFLWPLHDPKGALQSFLSECASRHPQILRVTVRSIAQNGLSSERKKEFFFWGGYCYNTSPGYWMLIKLILLLSLAFGCCWIFETKASWTFLSLAADARISHSCPVA